MLFQRCSGLGLLLVMMPAYVLSQESRPEFQIAAEVSDVSGAAMVGATVQVQGISAALKFRGTTNEAGKIRIQVDPGEYTISVMRLGFKTLTQQIEVASVQDQHFSFVLETDSLMTCTVPCTPPTLEVATEMSKLSDQLVLPPSPVVPPLKPQGLRRNPIVRLFSAIRASTL